MIWIIGGTSEAKLLVETLDKKVKYIVTCATECETEFIRKNLRIGRMDFHEMVEFIIENNIDLIVDMSHPYAAEVSKNARAAGEECRVKYIRFVRGKSTIEKDCIYLKTLEKCIEYLKDVKGTVFFTTGSKNIGDFEEVKGENRFIYRVLPSAVSMKECKGHGVMMKDIVACLGPFSTEFNIAMFKEYKADYVVMKDCGETGGTLEKIEACVKLGIIPIVIGREDEKGIGDIKEIKGLIEGFDK